MSDYVESFYFISDTEVVGVGKESASSMSMDDTYAFFGTYEWTVSGNTGYLSFVSTTDDFRSLSILRFDSQTRGSSEGLGTEIGITQAPLNSLPLSKVSLLQTWRTRPLHCRP